MIVFNTTYLVAKPVERKFLSWLSECYLPLVEATGLLRDPRLFKVLVDETEGVSYSLQFSAETVAQMGQFKKNHLPRLEEVLAERFGESVLPFSTYLKSCEL